MFKSHEVYTIAADDEKRFITAIQTEETEIAAWFKKEYPDGEDGFSINYDTCEHHGRIAIVASIDECWGDWCLDDFLERAGFEYTKEPCVYEYELKQAPYVSPDVDGFWVDGRSIQWHCVGDELPR